MHGSIRPAALAILAALALVLVPAVGADASPLQELVPGEVTVNVPPGGQATIDGSAFCLNFGEPFPKAVTVSSERAADPVIRVLRAAAQQGAGSEDLLQTQIAVWQAIEGQWGYKDKDVDMTVAKALAESATGQSTDPLLGRGLALDKAIADGLVTVTVDSWEQADAPKALPTDAPYYGVIRFTVHNAGSEPIDVSAPLGLVLKAADEAEQDMGLYAVSQQERELPKALPATGGNDRLGLWLLWAGALSASLGWIAARR